MRTIGRLIAAVALWTCAWSSVAAAQPILSPPKDFIVAIGDSLTFGFQQAKFNANLPDPEPEVFNTGFVDDFVRLVDGTSFGDDIKAVNFGCPGETSSSLLAGPCAYHAVDGFELHVNYSGAQIDAATAFITAHADEVGTIIVDIGSNDLLALVRSCGGLSNLGCIIAGAGSVTAQLAANYAEILTRLRAVAPRAEILVVQLYNPLALFAPATNAFLEQINGAIAFVAQEFGAIVANPFPGIDLAPPQPQTLCALTLICTPLADIHLSDLGYQFVGDLLFHASGYDRFVDQGNE
jgi:lysophospholipase L1-like esterase